MNADSEAAAVLDELIAREPIFHRPEWGITRADFENMTAPDFWEIGASGRRYDRDYVLKLLEQRHASSHHPLLQSDEWETSGFDCRRLADGVYLLTYTMLQNKKRKTRRTTIWQRTFDGWKILFHQGTLVQE
jgi:hypothetical protein